MLFSFKLDPRLWSILSVISSNPKGIQNKNIAKQLQIKAALVTMRSKELIEADYVVVKKDINDSRAKQMTLSNKGKTYISEVNAKLSLKLEEVVDGISDDELEIYFKVLQVIINNSSKL